MIAKQLDGVLPEPGEFTDNDKAILAEADAMWVTPCFGISSKIFAGSTLRRQTLMPADAATVHGKHQPLQWNIGSVHRYTGCWPRLPARMLLTAFKYAPR